MKKVGYHGTASNDIDNLIDNITKNGFIYEYRDNHWLGQGIYFFGEYEWAKQWARQPSNRDKDKCIFEVEIFCDDENFLDLDLVSTNKKIAKQLEYINKELKNDLKKHKFKDDHYKRCYYLDILKERYDYKIIKQTFPLVNKNKITQSIGIYISQIQFCVSSNENIKILNVNKINKNIVKKKKKVVY